MGNTTNMPSISPAKFTGALSLAANGVAIITTRLHNKQAGLTVSSLCSVCADPALILACVNTENEFCNLADEAGIFSINLLNSNQSDLSNEFAGLGSEPNVDRFKQGQWSYLTTGAPILEQALTSLDCVIHFTQTEGTHRIYVGRVVDIASSDKIPALIYTNRQYATSTPLLD